VQVIVKEAQDLVVAFACIACHFANLEVREASAQVLEAGDGLQVIIAIGGDEGAGQDPIGKESVIQDVEGFGLVAKVVFAAAVGRG
jgi:hypothetical protein